MPTKRELTGGGPLDGLQWSEFRWDRIDAFVGGVVCSLGYVRLDLFEYLPGWAAISLAVVPIGPLFYRLTEQSWQTALKVTVGVAVGTGLSPLSRFARARIPTVTSHLDQIRSRGNDRLRRLIKEGKRSDR